MGNTKVGNDIYSCAVDLELIPENEADAKIVYEIIKSINNK
jgi:hypothetical protein